MTLVDATARLTEALRELHRLTLLRLALAVLGFVDRHTRTRG